MAVNMNLGDQANLAALLRSLVWGSKGNMHISSRLSACSRLTGFCSSSFRGHFRSLFSPDYSVYWPPLCHGGFPPQPSPMAHRQFISVQDWPRLRLQQISAMATGRIGSQWELESRRPTLRMDGTLVLSCLSRWGASSSFAFQVCQSDFERNQQTYWQWPSHFDAFFWLFYFFLLVRDGADWSGWQSVITPVHLSVAVWPVVMCQQTGVFFTGRTCCIWCLPRKTNVHCLSKCCCF